MSVQSISPYSEIDVRVQKILSIAMAFDGKLSSIDLSNASDDVLDSLYGYAEEHTKRVAEIRKKGLKPSTKDITKEEIKKEQIAFLKEHEQEIVDFVKAQNQKVESFQIDWTDVRWSDGGFLLPDYSIEVYGTVNHIENSGWSASMPINDDDSIYLKKISIFNDITIGEEILE